MQNAAFRCGLIAFLFMAGCSSPAAQDARQHRSGKSQGNTEYRQPEAEQPWNWPITWQPKRTAVISGDDASKASVYKYKCEDPPTREDADACQQRRSAQATEDQYWMGFWAALASAAAAAFTGWAAWEAGKAATSAKDAADVAKSALTDIERAFVFCTNQEISPPINNDTKLGMFTIAFGFSNTGKTWAKHCRTYMSWKSFDSIMPEAFDFCDQNPIPEQKWAEKEPGKTFIGPNGRINLGPVMIPSRFIIDALEGRGHVYIWAWCEYDDIFQGTKRHRTEFCVRVQPLHAPIEPEAGKKAVSAAFIHHNTFNGADDDCLKPLQTGSPKNPLPKS